MIVNDKKSNDNTCKPQEKKQKNESNGEPASNETFILNGFPVGSYISIKPLIEAVIPVKKRRKIDMMLSNFTMTTPLENIDQ